MMFTLRMVWRELRAAWGRLLFFFLCVAIGVGAIAALRSVIQNVREALVRDLLGGVGKLPHRKRMPRREVREVGVGAVALHPTRL